MTVRVLVADDHGAIRSGLRLMLDEVDGIAVVGEAADGAAAVTNARSLRPDVVLMDIRMPGVDGIEATRAIVGAGVADVLVLTTFDLDEYVFGALRAGAAGFLLKTVDSATLADAVRRVAAGEGILSPEVTRRLLDEFAAAPEPTGRPAPAAIEDLTPREHEVLVGLGRGLSNADLAVRLGVSLATIKSHVSSVLAKLDCDSRMQAAVIAREAGLG